MNMKKMTQHAGGYCRHHNSRKQVPHSKTGWIDAAQQIPLSISREAQVQLWADPARTTLARREDARKPRNGSIAFVSARSAVPVPELI
jgi:hypothetical protein